MNVSKKMMVMPPIHRFAIEGFPKQSGWGWHRATELVEVVNNILVLRGESAMTAEQLNERFPFIELHSGIKDSILNDAPWTDVITESDGYGCHYVGDAGWLATLVRENMYLPAKIGMQFITAAKSPTLSEFRSIFRF